MLGTSPRNSALRTNGFQRKNPSRKIEDDNRLSRASLRNLCDALCEEIQIYKLLLKRAENLNGEEVAQSLEDLHSKCPAETAGRSCPERDPKLLDVPADRMYARAQYPKPPK